jgi:uncharacterized protein (DUF885 family)
MKRICLTMIALAMTTSCAFSGEGNPPSASPTEAQSERLRQMFDQYYEQYLVLFPHMATLAGDHRYDDRLANDISDEHRAKVAALADRYSRELSRMDRTGLPAGDQLSCEVFESDLRHMADGLKYPEHWIPVGQMDDGPTIFALLASGMSIQPFKAVADYEKFLGRVRDFTVWMDTAVANMRKGMDAGVVQPRVIMEKSATQMEGLLVPDLRQSVFYQPILQMPSNFTDPDKARLTQVYVEAIEKQIVPAYRKLISFIRQEYLPKCRDSVGFGALPDGIAWYAQRVRLATTTDLTPEQIFDLGLGEVARITAEMEKLKAETGFIGDLAALAKHLEETATTYRSKDELIQAYRHLRVHVEPNLPRLFNRLPKAGYEIRPVEQFREKTSQSQLVPGTPDGSRPSVFYVNAAGIEQKPMAISESLFLHEAVPGHHIQGALAFEQSDLPKFRRFGWYDAYGEGWALYAEGLGEELGCYRDAMQRLDALVSEMWRARRLVVDVGLHAKGWTRDRAINYMLEIPGFREPEAILEVDRYIGWPGQALSYKCGQLKINAIRSKAKKALGAKFEIRAFHDELLQDGGLPLDVLEAKMDRWITAQKKSGP